MARGRGAGSRRDRAERRGASGAETAPDPFAVITIVMMSATTTKIAMIRAAIFQIL
jgi:hypothetical protein